LNEPSDEPDPPTLYQRLDMTAHRPYARREYARRLAWEWVQRTAIRFSPRRAHRWRNWWLRRFGAEIAGATRPTTRIVHPWLLSLGSFSLLGEEVTVYNLGPVTIGEHSVVSQRAYLCAGSHDYTRPDLPLTRDPIRIGSGVWICAEAFIGPGVTIGDNAIVGARAVVARDVPPATIVAGNPARVIKTRPQPGAD
jgi:putative colanic acid biosynthesis acetyltransferase WcaF